MYLSINLLTTLLVAAAISEGFNIAALPVVMH
jgi:hypothetical protein